LEKAKADEGFENPEMAVTVMKLHNKPSTAQLFPCNCANRKDSKIKVSLTPTFPTIRNRKCPTKIRATDESGISIDQKFSAEFC
jgi:hypothetical protein